MRSPRFVLRWLRLLGLGLWLGWAVPAGGEPLHLAVIGPMSGHDQDKGRSMRAGVDLLVEQVNAAGGIDGRPLAVLVYDDRSDADEARRQAVAIAAESQTLAVIGHFYSALSLAAAPVYRDHGVPVITPSATSPALTEGNPWYFRVVPDNDLEGRLAALYTNGVLGHDSVAIAYEDDAFGTSLMAAFRRTAGELGLEITAAWAVDAGAEDVDERIEALARALQAPPWPDAVFLALFDREAAKLVRLVREAGADIAIVGGTSVGLESFPRQFEALPYVVMPAARYTDGIYAINFYIRDVGDHLAQHFSHAFRLRHGRESDALAATSYDAAAMAATAIRRARERDAGEHRGAEAVRPELAGVDDPEQWRALARTDLAHRRAAVREALAGVDGPARAHHGVTGAIYFDTDGDAVKSAPFGIYLGDKLISAPVQLTPIATPEAVLDLEPELARGNVMAFGQGFLYKTAVVYVGLDLDEISHIDQKVGSFDADFHLWFRHRSELDYGRIEFLNSVDGITLGEDPLIDVMLGGIRYRAYRIRSRFQETFRFHEYPFDAQALGIRFRHRDLGRERLIFVADDLGMRRGRHGDPTRQLHAQPTLAAGQEWTLRRVLVYSDIGVADTTLGNPRLFEAGADTVRSYSRFNVVVEVERNSLSYVLKNLIPLFLIILVGYAMFYVSTKGPSFTARMNLGLSALLTSVFFHLQAANQLPTIGYLVALDYVYFVVYALILSGLVVTIAEHHAHLRGRDALAERMDFFGRVLLPLLALATAAVMGLLYV